MRTGLAPLLALVLAALALSACGDDDPASSECDLARIQGELAAAVPGDTVTLSGCRVVGTLSVPAGVTLAGADAGATTIVAPPNGVAIEVAPGELVSRVARLRVESDGCAAIVARGTGAVAIEDVDVRITRGIGVGIEGATSATLSAVGVTGTLTPEVAATSSAPLPPFTCGSHAVPTHGVVLVDVDDAQVSAVTTRDVGAIGLLAIRSGLTWSGGGASGGLGAGAVVWGGRAQLIGVELTNVGQGLSAIEVFGGVVAGGADVTSTGLTVTNNAGYGVMHDGATASHLDLLATDNAFAGVWAQRTTSFALTGAGTSLARNGFAGVAVVDAAGARIEGATIEDTVERVSIGGTRTIRAADGIQLVRTEASITDVALRANPRVGLLLDLGGASTSTVSLTGVVVDATGTALGAIAQNGTAEAGWDTGVMRVGATAANDAAFTGVLDVAEAVGPPCLPPLADAETRGLGALIEP